MFPKSGRKEKRRKSKHVFRQEIREDAKFRSRRTNGSLVILGTGTCTYNTIIITIITIVLPSHFEYTERTDTNLKGTFRDTSNTRKELTLI